MGLHRVVWQLTIDLNSSLSKLASRISSSTVAIAVPSSHTMDGKQPLGESSGDVLCMRLR